MKTNQYIEKYGEKALQIYKKSLRNTNDELASNQNQVLPPKLSKRNKSGSLKSLNKSSKSKAKLPSQANFTFSRIPEKQHSKLVISGLSTPKNKHNKIVPVRERTHSSSTKKKGIHNKISERIHQALHKSKSIKSTVKATIECLDLMAQEEAKICQWINQIKDIFIHISSQANLYRKKWKEQHNNTKKMKKEIEDLKLNMKINAVIGQKKRKPIQVVIYEENQKLRTQIQKLEQKLSNFERKEMVLVSAIEQLKSSHSEIGKEKEFESSSKFRQDFYGQLNKERQERIDSQQQSDLDP